MSFPSICSFEPTARYYFYCNWAESTSLFAIHTSHESSKQIQTKYLFERNVSSGIDAVLLLCAQMYKSRSHLHRPIHLNTHLKEIGNSSISLPWNANATSRDLSQDSNWAWSDHPKVYVSWARSKSNIQWYLFLILANDIELWIFLFRVFAQPAWKSKFWLLPNIPVTLDDPLLFHAMPNFNSGTKTLNLTK